MNAKLIVASALCLPLIAFALPAAAASTHDLQSGMHTTNTHSGMMMGSMKKMKMMKKHKMHMKKMM